MTDKPIAAPGEPMISCDACRAATCQLLSWLGWEFATPIRVMALGTACSPRH